MGPGVPASLLNDADRAMAQLANWRGRAFQRDVHMEMVSDDPEGRDGWYDSERQVLVLVAGRSAVFTRLTLIHELTHALQDQHFGLAALASLPRTPDAEAAWRALVEGEATLASAELNDFDLSKHPILPRGPGQDDNEQVLFTYMTGAQYVSTLRDSEGWSSVDDAWSRPPQSPAEVLAIAIPDAPRP